MSEDNQDHQYSETKITGEARVHLGHIHYPTVQHPAVHANDNSRVHLGDRYKNYYIRIDAAAGSILQECEEVFASLTKQPARAERLCVLTNGCNDTFRELDAIVSRYQGFGLQQKRTWERVGWEDKTIAELRSRITTQTSMLTTFMATSQIRAEQKLEELLQEYRSGRKDGSVISCLTVDSLDADQRAQWRTIRKELEEHGITIEMFNANKEFILSWIAKAISEHALEEDEITTSASEDVSWARSEDHGLTGEAEHDLQQSARRNSGLYERIRGTSPLGLVMFDSHGSMKTFTPSIKKRIKSMISTPKQPVHVTHMSFDRGSRHFTGLPIEWMQLLRAYEDPGSSSDEPRTSQPGMNLSTDFKTTTGSVNPYPGLSHVNFESPRPAPSPSGTPTIRADDGPDDHVAGSCAIPQSEHPKDIAQKPETDDKRYRNFSRLSLSTKRTSNHHDGKLDIPT